jgi:hypothetical protein
VDVVMSVGVTAGALGALPPPPHAAVVRETAIKPTIAKRLSDMTAPP